MREAGETVNLFPTPPAVGAPQIVSVTDGELWNLSTVYFVVNTDVAAAPRVCHVEFMTAAGLVYWRVVFNTTQANTTTRHYCVGRRGNLQVSTQGTVTIQSRLPDAAWLFNFGNAEQLRVNLVPFGAGDSIGAAALTYHRWRE